MLAFRPTSKTYNPYFQRYIDLVPEGAYGDLYDENTKLTVAFFSQMPTDKHDYKYASDKWTVKQILMHLIDSDRVMACRILAAARGDGQSVMPPMDENEYAAQAPFTNRTMDDILSEFLAVRASTKHLLFNLSAEQCELTCNMLGFNTSVNALAYIIIGHTIHHMNVIQERYI